MTEPVGPNRVLEVRRRWESCPDEALIAGDVSADVLALCDTVESLRDERDELAEMLVEGAVDGDELVTSLRAKQAERDELETLRAANERTSRQAIRDELAEIIGGGAWAELETLRGIAKRLADGWATLPASTRYPEAQWVERRLGGGSEPMTEAEVHAIYGKGKEDDPLAALNDARVVFWSCPEDHPAEPPRQTVEWVTEGNVMTPVCLDCGNRGPSHTIYGQKEDAHE